MHYIQVTADAKIALTKLSEKRKVDGALNKSKIDVASEAIINASKKECEK